MGDARKSIQKLPIFPCGKWAVFAVRPAALDTHTKAEEVNLRLLRGDNVILLLCFCYSV